MPGRRSDPPWSVPCASHTSPVASATAPPPVEPPQVSDVFHGLRVQPNTSLNVLPPAPNSGRVRLGDDDAALALDALHHRMRSRRYVIAEDRRAIGRAHAGDVGQVLDRHRQPGEPAGFAFGVAPGAVHQPLRMIARAVETQGRQGIHRRLHRGDARGRGVDQIERRNLPPPQSGNRFGRGQAGQFVGSSRRVSVDRSRANRRGARWRTSLTQKMTASGRRSAWH